MDNLHKAAPDMLAALRLAEQQIHDATNAGGESWAKGTLAVIRHAIAKATGGGNA